MNTPPTCHKCGRPAPLGLVPDPDTSIPPRWVCDPCAQRFIDQLLGRKKVQVSDNREVAVRVLSSPSTDNGFELTFPFARGRLLAPEGQARHVLTRQAAERLIIDLTKALQEPLRGPRAHLY